MDQILPGRKPGTSTRVMIGMLKASQNRTNRPALIEAFMSRHPAATFGFFWFKIVTFDRYFGQNRKKLIDKPT